MNVTLSVDEKLVSNARKIAAGMGKSLDQLIVEYLERMTQQQEIESDFCEFLSLSGKGGGRAGSLIVVSCMRGGSCACSLTVFG